MTDQPEKLPLIGRDRVLIENLAKALHMAARRVGDYTPLWETPRGNTFEVLLADGRIAKVTIVLDRIDGKMETSTADESPAANQAH